jgi:uncharacterized RDD family membrane protein YckC
MQPSVLSPQPSPLQSATLAPLWLRLLAVVYDLLPLLGLWFLAAVLALAVTSGTLDVQHVGGKLLVQIPVLAFSAAYFVVSWLRGGQTIGMKPWRLRVIRADGSPLRAGHALLRFAVALLSLAPLGAGYWWTLIDRERRAWHDLAAGTLVVRLDKAQRAT